MAKLNGEPKPVGLSPKQQRFVDEYPVDLNATQAAIRAGYSLASADSQASRLLKNVKVRDALDAAAAARSVRTCLTVDDVMDRLTTIADRCMQAEAVLDREGKPTGEYKFDSKGANTALSLVGKQLGMFRTNVDLTVRKPHEDALDELE